MAIAAVAGFAAAGCNPDSQAGELKAAAGDGAGASAQVVNVQVLTLQPEEFTNYVRILAEVEAWSDVTVSAEEAGVIEIFYVEKGTAVREGQRIAKIDDRVLRAQVDEAKAAYDLAMWRFDSQRQLWEDEKIGSELSYQEAKHNAELQRARLANFEARLDRTVIRAPFSGIFDEHYIDAGERVNPGSAVARFIDVSRLKVVGGVPERYASAVQPGDPVRINFDLVDQDLDGAIGYVGSAVDTRNRTFPIEIVMDNPNGVIKPQMIAGVEIATDHFDSAIVVPQNAVIRTERGYQVYVVEEDDGELYARSRPVEVGPSYADAIVLEAGVSFGDRVVIRGQQLVEAGDRVRIVNRERNASEEDAS